MRVSLNEWFIVGQFVPVVTARWYGYGVVEFNSQLDIFQVILTDNLPT